MKYAWVLLALFFFTLIGQTEASAEWVELITDDAAGYVVSSRGDTYMIDVGISMGARRGGLYLVYADGQGNGGYGEITGTPKTPKTPKIPLALLKVREPSTTHSFCAVVAPRGGFELRPGDKVIPISAKRAKRVRFASVRPVERPAPASPPYPAQNPAPMPVVPPRSEPPYPPYPNYPAIGQDVLDFDANNIADARLIRTFPLSQAEMNALEIEHRGAWNLYAKGRFSDALDSFSRQSVNFRGNYLSPYWAGMSALKLGNLQAAIGWFDTALVVNPYFLPARNAKINAPKYLSQQKNQKKKKPAKRTVRTKRAAKKAEARSHPLDSGYTVNAKPGSIRQCYRRTGV
ncbi:MAG: hypothetical protein LBS35_04110 [Synergistaceae bacterium]|jgi:hypothetical protein|nr:hypothetical protein [Synergistaceae bacterium]